MRTILPNESFSLKSRSGALEEASYFFGVELLRKFPVGFAEAQKEQSSSDEAENSCRDTSHPPTHSFTNSVNE